MGNHCTKRPRTRINFASEFSGSSVADDARDSDFSYQESPGRVSLFGSGTRQCIVKDAKEQRQLKDEVVEDHLYDGIPRLPPPQKPRPTRYTHTAVSKVTEASKLLGKAGLGKAKDVLDTFGSSMTDLSSSGGFNSGVATKGEELGILAFEVANTIVKSSNLIESLSQKNIMHLKETVLYSQGVQNLVSNDLDELLRFVAADKRQELQVFLGEVVRFGNRSKDFQWHNLERYFDRINKELTPQRQLNEDAVLVVEQLMVLVQYTAELYQELQVLDRLKKDYELKRREENSSSSSKGNGLAILKTELKSQRKIVKSLKKKSLWCRGFEEVLVKLVDIVHFLLLEIHNIFGGADDQSLKKGAADCDQRLGPAGLALHYANMIVQIDTLVARSSSITSNARDSLYQNLPPGIKLALRSKIKSFKVDKELSVTQIKDEMERTLHWLVPIAANTTKAHHGFGWVGEWGSTGTDFTSKPSGGDTLRIETLYHASKEKTENYILGQIIWLQHLVTKIKSNAQGGPRLSSIKSRLNTAKQQVISEPSSVPLVTDEEQKMLQEVIKRKRTPRVSKSHDFDSEYSRVRKCDPLSKSSNYFRGVRRCKSAAVKRFSSGFPLLDFVIDKEKALDVIDRVDVPRDYKALLKEGSLSF